jgi:4-hydroxybenzoate polyprenyltransferase
MSQLSAPSREGQTVSGASRLVRYVNLVRLPHTVFALPFALVGATLASYEHPVTISMVGWIVLAFTCARFAAMGFNRIADREIDARNPRTRMRELPSGALGTREAFASVVLAGMVFLFAAWRLNPLCAWLAPFALAWVLAYSYTKRFTRWSHIVLGVGMAIAPVGGYLAVAGQWGEPWWMLLALALAVTTWGAGFDILYALQDRAFDISEGLHSMPVAIGVPNALRLSRVLHVVTLLSLGAVGYAHGGGFIFALGVAVTAALFLYEHSLVSADDLSRLDAAFFTMNGIISITFFAFVLAGRLMQAPPC